MTETVGEVVRVYVHKTQTPYCLNNSSGKVVPIPSERLVEIKGFCSMYYTMQIVLRYIQTDVSEGEKGNLGGFACGTLDKHLTIREEGTSAEEIKAGIQREILRHYEGVSFPVGGLKSIDDLFVFGIHYGTDAIHEGLFRFMDKNLADYDLVPLQ